MFIVEVNCENVLVLVEQKNERQSDKSKIKTILSNLVQKTGAWIMELD